MIELFIFIWVLMSIVLFQSVRLGNEELPNLHNSGDEQKQFRSTQRLVPTRVVKPIWLDLFEDTSKMVVWMTTAGGIFQMKSATVTGVQFPGAAEIGAIIDEGEAYDFNNNHDYDFWAWMGSLDQGERHTFASAGWKTRRYQYNEQYIISGMALGGILVGGIALAVLASKKRIVHGQINPANKRMITYRNNLPETYYPAVYRHLFGTGGLTDDQIRLLYNQFEALIDDHKWKLPKECFEIAAKVYGRYNFKLPFDDKSKIAIDQTIDFLLFSTSSNLTPVIDVGTGQADANIVTILDMLTYFYSEIERISMLAEYNDKNSGVNIYEVFKGKYTPIDVTSESLSLWPEIKVPFFIPYMRTHHDTLQTRYEVQLDDRYSAAGSLADLHFLQALRPTAAGSETIFMSVRMLPNMTEDEMKRLIVVGFFLIGGLFNDGFAFTTATQQNFAETVSFGCHMELLLVNDKGEIIAREAAEAEADAVFDWSDINANRLVSIWNKTEHDPWRNLFLVTFVNEPAIAVVNSHDLYQLNADSMTVQYDAAGRWLDEFYGRYNVNLTSIYRPWIKEPMLSFFNPHVAAPVEMEPENKSGVSAGTYQDEKDIGKLQSFIKVLEAQAAFHKKLEHSDQVANREKTIAGVKERITSLEKEKEVKSTPPLRTGEPDTGGADPPPTT